MDWSSIVPVSVFKNPKAMLTNPTAPLLGVPFNDSWNSVLEPSNVTDALGITDTKAGERGLDTLQQYATNASNNLDANMAEVNDMYKNAMEGRSMNDTLNDYRANLGAALGSYNQNMQKSVGTYGNQMMGTEQAAGAKNVQNFLDPMYSRNIQNATNQALAGAGSSLQSSAANQAVSNAVGNQVSNMWNQAFQQAMADAQNKQGIYTNTANERENTFGNMFKNQGNTYGAIMQSDLMPSLNWMQLQSDVAGTKYTKDMDLAQAAAQVAGQNQSWLGNFF